LKKPVKSALRRTVLVEVRETLNKQKVDTPEGETTEEYKEGIKRSDSASDIGSVKSGSTAKSIEVVVVKDS
jgi:hypothetical protein